MNIQIAMLLIVIGISFGQILSYLFNRKWFYIVHTILISFALVYPYIISFTWQYKAQAVHWTFFTTLYLIPVFASLAIGLLLYKIKSAPSSIF